nr:MAG TPA: nucleotidyltransferase-like protein [Caudoviricetes sp.]
MDLSLTLQSQIAQLGARYGATKIVLFGSRARGDNHPRSDIDLAIYGMPERQQAPFYFAVEEELQTLLKFDLVHITEHTSPALLENIRKDGITIMESYSEKLKNFEKALTRLQESIEEYNQTHSDTVRDGVIQRFEFTCELSWKTTREFLLDQGYSEINSPKAVMREAYSYGLIKDDQEWIHLLNDRNLTAHLYDEKAAAEIYHRIVSHHVGCFAQLLEQLKNN